MSEQIKKPDPPQYLDEYGLGLWRRALRNLTKMGTLHSADFDLLAQYCFSLSMCHKLAPKIREEGEVVEFKNKFGAVNKVVNPKFRIWKENLAISVKIAQYFGFTPESRKKIGAKKKEEIENDFDKI